MENQRIKSLRAGAWRCTNDDVINTHALILLALFFDIKPYLQIKGLDMKEKIINNYCVEDAIS